MRAMDEKKKRQYKQAYDRRYGVRDLSPLQLNDKVLIKLDSDKKWHSPSTVIKECAPRSYTLRTPTGVLRRNRRHLKKAEFLPDAGCNPDSGAPSPGVGLRPYHPSVPKPHDPHSPLFAVPRRDDLGEPASKPTAEPEARPSPETPGQPSSEVASPTTPVPVTARTTRSGRAVQLPACYKD